MFQLLSCVTHDSMLMGMTAPMQVSSSDQRMHGRTSAPRRYLMCRPTFFAVDYAINPWMRPDEPVDAARAEAQWQVLHDTYVSLGHAVEVIEGVPGLPDAVFSANGALVVDGYAYGARFLHIERQPEEALYKEALRRHGFRIVVEPEHTNEGEGDFLVVGSMILAGTGFRTSADSHGEVERLFGLPVVTLRLVDPRFYHLDTALAVLDERTIAYHPAAFSRGSRRLLERLFPDAILVEKDAAVLGLNAVSDGRNVVVSSAATEFASQLVDRGFRPVPVDLSELLKAGGGAKCCTLELRGRPRDAHPALPVSGGRSV